MFFVESYVAQCRWELRRVERHQVSLVLRRSIDVGKSYWFYSSTVNNDDMNQRNDGSKEFLYQELID